ncbi:heterokaryon incompatibility protein-domain-containing protein [Xylaria curta]|nr:heterokaryon incompatibility protein-domain-containing protein [Xylaria curta]
MLRQCRETHWECKQSKQIETRLPTRVLFIGSKSDTTIKIIEKSQDQARYMCLSHCWGNTKSIKTTNQNMSIHKINIPWTDLPKVYRDAITFCRELEVQYLWIDSLCIKQDDEEDWAKESSNMASIYENSYLTLAATSARNHDESCASQLSAMHHFKDVGRIRLKDSVTSFPVLVRRPLFHPHNSSEWLEGDEQRKLHHLRAIDKLHKAAFPLLSRAWVFQERFLPTRVLHFLPNELMWECKNGIECECQGITPLSDLSRDFVQRKQFTTRPQRMTFEHCNACERLRIWNEILQGFTDLELTFSKDRLPAISGLAVKVQGDGDRYVAGLWESSLPDALFWRRDMLNILMSQIPSRPEPLAAPTWSWASISSAQLHFRARKCRACIGKQSTQLESVDVRPATANPYGTVNANATLVISGTVSSGFLHLRGKRPFFVIAGTSIQFEFEPDYNLEHPGRYYVSHGTPLVCLFREHKQTDDPKGYHTEGLILRGIIERSLRYERIGFAAVHVLNPEEFAMIHKSLFWLI